MLKELFVEKAKTVHELKYDYVGLENIIKSKDRLCVVCPEHGKFTQRATNHLQGRGCPLCRPESHNRLCLSEFVQKARLTHGGKYIYNNAVYKGAHAKICIMCPDHGGFWQSPTNHLSGCGCPDCSGNKKLTTQQFVENAGKTHRDYDYSKSVYKNWKTGLVIACPIHGEFIQNPNNHVSKRSKCPKCAATVSRFQEDVATCIPDDIEFVVNHKGDKFDYDLYVPSHNLAIECHGFFWHGINSIKDDCFKTRDKVTEAVRDGITLKQLFDYEFYTKKQIVRSMIKHWLGRSTKIGGRQCSIITGNFADFFAKNHLQGHRDCNIQYALIKDGIIYAAASFARRHGEYEYELIRYTCLADHTVVGGFAKILNRFIQDYKTNSIFTFSDRRYSNGELYRANGFDHIGVSAPNYKYIKGSSKFLILSRNKCQKRKLSTLLGERFDPNKSETKNMLAAGYTKVFDAGNDKWLKTNGNTSSR